jgi:hypothetical protein
MRKHVFLGAASLLVIAGCGGGGGSAISGGGGPIPAPTATPVGSAEFTVDARTGAVTIKPLSDSRAAFGGNSLSFTSTMLLSEGSPERRVLKVTAKNNTQETIGQDGSFRVLFSNFRNDNTTSTDLRSTVKATTYWGNGTAAFTYGPLSTSQVHTPDHVSYNEATGRLFMSGVSGIISSAAQGNSSNYQGMFAGGRGVAAGPGFTLYATVTGIIALYDDNTFEEMVGSTVGFVNGDFATAQFTDINDIYLVRATSANDFEALVADGTRIRRVVRTPAFPAGDVSSLASLGIPLKSVAEKNGVLYTTSGNNVIVIDEQLTTLFMGSVAAFADGLQANLRFNNPGRLRWIGDNLFVADTGNHRIRQLNLRPGANPVGINAWWGSTLSGTGTAGGVDGTGSFITHNGPISLTKGVGDELFVADQSGHRIRRITPINGRFTSNFPDGTPNPIELPVLSNPSGFAPSEPKPDPYIAETASIAPGASLELGEWQFSLPEGLKTFSFVVTVEAETAAHGVLPSVLNTGTGTKGSPNVLVRGFAGRLGSGYTDGPLSTSAFAGISGVAAAADGTIFVSDILNKAIRRIGTNGQVTTILGGSPTGGTVDGTSDFSQVELVGGIACSPDGLTLYFSQSNHVIRTATANPAVDPATRNAWSVTTIAGLAGTSGTTDATSGTNARFTNPGAVFYVSPTNIYVLEDTRIRSISKTGSGTSSADYSVRTLAGGTTAGNINATGSAARFGGCYSGGLAPNGDLLVADAGNFLIRKVTPGGVVTTHAGSGLWGYQDSLNPANARISWTWGLAVDKSGYAYVKDVTNNLIRRVSPSGSITTVAGTLNQIGSTDGPGNTALFQETASFMVVLPGGDLLFSDLTRLRLIQRVISN